MLPDLTAFMISSSCGIRVLPKNCMSSAPLDCAFTSLAIQSNATAADSGMALMWAKTSFFGEPCAKAGARPVARIPAIPAPARSSVRRLSETRHETRLFAAVMSFLQMFFLLGRWTGSRVPSLQHRGGLARGLFGHSANADRHRVQSCCGAVEG